MVERNKVLYELQAEICYALSHPIRLEILDLVSHNEKSSTELLAVLDIPKANLSQHLSVLKDAGILKTRKDGQFQFVSLALPKIKDACSLVRGILADRIQDEEKRMVELKKNLNQHVKSINSKTIKKSLKKRTNHE
jgi:DNA-binding transcriptional ArsR family regulator